MYRLVLRLGDLDFPFLSFPRLHCHSRESGNLFTSLTTPSSFRLACTEPAKCVRNLPSSLLNKEGLGEVTTSLLNKEGLGGVTTSLLNKEGLREVTTSLLNKEGLREV